MGGWTRLDAKRARLAAKGLLARWQRSKRIDSTVWRCTLAGFLKNAFLSRRIQGSPLGENVLRADFQARPLALLRYVSELRGKSLRAKSEPDCLGKEARGFPLLRHRRKRSDISLAVDVGFFSGTTLA
jgi:hypothetical protein